MWVVRSMNFYICSALTQLAVFSTALNNKTSYEPCYRNIFARNDSGVVSTDTFICFLAAKSTSLKLTGVNTHDNSNVLRAGKVHFVACRLVMFVKVFGPHFRNIELSGKQVGIVIFVYIGPVFYLLLEIEHQVFQK